jgi:hypothetical protein
MKIDFDKVRRDVEKLGLDAYCYTSISQIEQQESEKRKQRLLDFIKQAQKQEKLLELYKEYFEYSEMLKDGRKFGGRMLVEHERDKIIEQIKELENEFK